MMASVGTSFFPISSCQPPIEDGNTLVVHYYNGGKCSYYGNTGGFLILLSECDISAELDLIQ